jgi:pyridoxine kinase
MAVLTIQSHVAYGYSGNTAAVFPIQRLGHEAWAVNTVEFSNHTGYESWRGRIMDPALAGELVEGIAERGVLGQCEALASGYMGDGRVSEAILEALAKVKRANPKALYCCDPVMGDLGLGFYVHSDIPGIFKTRLVPAADIVTPNQFELEALTGIPIRGLADAEKAIAALHRMGPRIVLVTSYRGGAGEGSQGIAMLADDGEALYRVETPELPLPETVSGTGDATTAIFLCRCLEGRSVKEALELCAAAIYGVLEATWKAGAPEIQLIAAQDEIVNPSCRFKAEKL